MGSVHPLPVPRPARRPADEVRSAASASITSSTSISSPELGARIVKDSLTLVRALGYDMNSVEFAVRDGVPYAIDFMNPAPDMDINSLTPHYFEWAVHAHGRLGDPAGEAAAAQARTSSAASSCSAGAKGDLGDIGGIARRRSTRYHELLTGELAAESQALARRADSSARPVLRRAAAVHGAAAAVALAAAVSLSRRSRGAWCCARFATAQRAALADDERARAVPAHGLGGAARDASIRDFATRARRRGSMRSSSMTATAGCASPSTTPRRRRARAYNDVLTEVFFGLPVMREFLRTAASAAAAGATRRAARAARRVRGVVGHARHAEDRDRRLARRADAQRVPALRGLLRAPGDRVHDRRSARSRVRRTACCALATVDIDLIYKRVLIHELVERGGIDHPVIRAVRDRAVCMVNPFSLQDAAQEGEPRACSATSATRALFDAEEREAIEAHIPWTRVVEERRHDVRRARRSTCPVHRATIASSSCSSRTTSTAGRASCSAGKSTTRSGRRRLAAALDEPYIVQERIALPTEPYPSVVDGKSRSSTAWSTRRRSWRTARTSTAADAPRHGGAAQRHRGRRSRTFRRTSSSRDSTRL